MTRPFVRLPRAALSGFFFVAYGLFALPFAPLLFVLPKRAGRWCVRVFYQGFVVLARLTGLYTVRVEGRPAEPPRGKLIVMNHVSLIDICVLLAHLPDSVCIVKAAAKRNPFLAVVVRKIFIANDKGGEVTLAEATDYLARGVNVVIFPQGTRGGTKLHRGAARFALAAQAEILPVHVDYDPVVLAKGQPWWDVGDKIIRICLTFRAPFVADGVNDHRTAVALTDRIASALSL